MARFSFNLADLDGSNGFLITNSVIAPNLSLGDFNGDGIEDLVVSSPISILGSQIEQDSYIVYGSSTFPPSLSITDINGSNGIVLNNAFAIGNTVADINGDGFDDLLQSSLEISSLEAPSFVSNLFFGSSSLPATIDASALDGTNGFKISSSELITFGQDIDINGDGNDDLVFFSLDVNLSAGPFGANYVVFGNSEGFPASFDPTTVDGSNGFIITPGSFSFASSSRKDINGDGIEDLSFSLTSGNVGASVLFGSQTFPASLDLSTLDGNNGFNITTADVTENDVFVAVFIDDVNGDGIADIDVNRASFDNLDFTDPNSVENPNSQTSFIIFGSETFPSTFDLTTLDGSNGFAIANSNSESLNVIISENLDFNNDGLQDFVVTDETSNQNYLVFGREQFTDTIDLANLNGENGFAVNGVDSNSSQVGDINGDDFEDLVLEATDGSTYVVFGSADNFSETVDLNAPDANALLISGQEANSSLTDIIDLNNDGADDLVFGSALFDDLSQPVVGANTQVVFGDLTMGVSEAPQNPQGSQTVYRFFNNDTGVHFYTANPSERDAVSDLPNFSFEGVSYRGVDPLTGAGNPVPVYRFLNEDTGVHLYTVSEAERDAVEDLANFSFEGEAFLAYETEVDGSIPIYRFFNPTTGAHFYTPSATERDNVANNLPEYQSEGIAYYALPVESEVI